MKIPPLSIKVENKQEEQAVVKVLESAGLKKFYWEGLESQKYVHVYASGYFTDTPFAEKEEISYTDFMAQYSVTSSEDSMKTFKVGDRVKYGSQVATIAFYMKSKEVSPLLILRDEPDVNCYAGLEDAIVEGFKPVKGKEYYLWVAENDLQLCEPEKEAIKVTKKTNGVRVEVDTDEVVKHITNFPKTMLKKATTFIKGLQEPTKSYVRLGWLEVENDEYVVTEEGESAMTFVTFGLAPEKTLADFAKYEVARLEKEDKKAKK